MIFTLSPVNANNNHYLILSATIVVNSAIKTKKLTIAYKKSVDKIKKKKNALWVYYAQRASSGVKIDIR